MKVTKQKILTMIGYSIRAGDSRLQTKVKKRTLQRERFPISQPGESRKIIDSKHAGLVGDMYVSSQEGNQKNNRNTTDLRGFLVPDLQLC